MAKYDTDARLVRWVRDGLRFIDGIAYRRGTGDEDIMGRAESRNLVGLGDVEIVGTMASLASVRLVRPMDKGGDE